jgi:hypothetical protein
MTKMPIDYYWLVLWDSAMLIVIATYIVREESVPGTLYLTLSCS